MIIHRLYLGTWFPRTPIHLKEVFNFLENVHGVKGLNQKKLNELHKSLGVTEIKLNQELDLDSLEAFFPEGSFLVTEDGVLTIKSGQSNLGELEDFEKARSELIEFNTKKLGPALGYLFNLGAPIPRDLADIKTVLPFIAIVSGADNEIKRIYDSLNEKQTSVIKIESLEIHRSPLLTLVHVKDHEPDLKLLESFVQHDIFFREFEFLLEEYLLRHRTYWDEITQIRESQILRYKDFPKIRRRLLEIRRIVVYVEARLLQMRDILKERERTILPEDMKFLDKVGLDRFAILESSQAYISHLWTMTFQSLDGTVTLLQTLYEENTQKELAVIKVTTFITALTGFFGMNIGFPWQERWLMERDYSFLVALAVVLGALAFYFILKWLVLYRRFEVGRDKEF